MKRQIILTGHAVLVFFSLSSASFAGDIQPPTHKDMPADVSKGKIGTQGSLTDFPLCSDQAKVYPLNTAWGFENGLSCRFVSLDAANKAQQFPLCTQAALIYTQDPSWGWENNVSCWRGMQDIQATQNAQHKPVTK